jgi:hypothetical protein
VQGVKRDDAVAAVGGGGLVVASLPFAVRLRRTVLTVIGLAACAGLLYARSIPCIFAKVTHHPCPGCGSTRACFALLHGDLGGVVQYNPLGPVAALLIGILAAQAIVSVFVHGDFRDTGEKRLGYIVKRGIIAVAVLEIVLWVVRFFGAFGGPVPV